jgi:hypothetical protein
MTKVFFEVLTFCTYLICGVKLGINMFVLTIILAKGCIINFTKANPYPGKESKKKMRQDNG